MSVDKKVKEIEDKWKRIGELIPPAGSKPADAFTRVEFQAKFNMSKSVAGSRLEKMVKEGKLEKGGIGSGTWYRLKEGK